MKTKVFALVLALMCVLGATCCAQRIPRNPNAVPLPRERMALGGLHVADTMDYVQSIYGEPDSQESGYSYASERGYAIWKYGDSVTIYFYQNPDNEEFYIQVIHVTADNGFTTPDGIKIGSDIKMLKKAYGEAALQPTEKNGDGKYWYFNDKINYVHYLFNVKNGKIVRMALGFNN